MRKVAISLRFYIKMRIYYINSDTEGSPACFDTVFPVKIFRRLSYNFETSLEHIKMKKITAFLLMLTLFTIPLLAQKASQFKGVAQLQSPQGPPPMGIIIHGGAGVI